MADQDSAKMNKNSYIRFDNCEIELIEREGVFVGIGEVRVAGQLLRSSARPMSVEIRNPNGVLVSGYREISRVVSKDKAILKFSMQQESSGPMEFMLHTIRPRYNTANWTVGAVPLSGEFTLTITPIERTFGKTRFLGFSYQYSYTSEELPIYKILDRSTWELGGRSIGNEIWMRNGTVASIKKIQDIADAYSTEWYLPGIHQPNIFQFFPLQTAMQGFTMTYSDEGALVTWPTEVSHVRTLIEKSTDDDVIVHWHEHCGDLNHTFSTPPVEVLFAPVSRSKHVDRLNLYEDVRSTVWTTLHQQIGMREERVVPYGVMEEWGLPDLDKYRASGLPKLADAGIKMIMLPSEFQNNMNVYGVSNMCCTLDLNVAESVGERKLTDLCSDARAKDIRIEMWGNTSVSTLTEIFSRKNPGGENVKFLPEEGSIMDRIFEGGDPWVRNLSGAIEADHYTPVFAVMNLRHKAVQDYWLEKWGYAHTHIGLEGIFVDSSFNLSSDKFHYIQNAGGRAGGATIDQTQLHGKARPNTNPNQVVLSQFRAYLDLMVKMQALGYSISAEDVGVFGISRSGPDAAQRAKCLPLWLESLCNFDTHLLQRAGYKPDNIFFEGLAYRVMWQLYWNPHRDALTFFQDGPRDDKDRPTAFHRELYKAFGKVGDLMYNRHISSDEAWVRYSKDDKECYWVLRPCSVSFGRPKSILDVIGNTSLVSDTLEGEPHRVYVVH